MKTSIITILIILFTVPTVIAAKIEDNAKIAVLNFGTLNNSKINGLNLNKTEKALYDYAVEYLTDSKQFEVIELSEEKLKSQNINPVGIVSLDEVKLIGELLKIKYIICGKLLNITADETDVKILENGLALHAVRAKIIVTMIDTETGRIIVAAKGEGKSQSSLVKVGTAKIGAITLGTKTVTQDSVTQSLKKATRQSIDNLIIQLYKK